MRRLEQTINYLRKGVRGFVGDERLHFRLGRGITHQIKVSPADKCHAVGRERRNHSLLLKLRQNERVNRILYPLLEIQLGLRRLRIFHRLESPVSLGLLLGLLALEDATGLTRPRVRRTHSHPSLKVSD